MFTSADETVKSIPSVTVIEACSGTLKPGLKLIECGPVYIEHIQD